MYSHACVCTHTHTHAHTHKHTHTRTHAHTHTHTATHAATDSADVADAAVDVDVGDGTGLFGKGFWRPWPEADADDAPSTPAREGPPAEGARALSRRAREGACMRACS